MTRRGKFISWFVVAMLIAGGLWLAIDRLYLRPVAQRQTQLEQVRVQAASFAQAQRRMVSGTQRQTDRIASTLLAGDLEELQHRLRAGFTRIAQHCGLDEIVVSSGKPMPIKSPLLGAHLQTKELTKSLRSTPDFSIVRGRLSAIGTLDEVLMAVAFVEAQPWVHRFEGLGIEPNDKKRKRFRVTIDFATLHAPLMFSGHAPTPELVEPDADLSALVRQLNASNPFAAFVSPNPRAEVVVATEEPNEVDVLGEWRLVGIVDGESVEVWLVHGQTHERAVLVAGEAIGRAIFESGTNETAVFMIDGVRYTLYAGQQMKERQPIEEGHP